MYRYQTAPNWGTSAFGWRQAIAMNRVSIEQINLIRDESSDLCAPIGPYVVNASVPRAHMSEDEVQVIQRDTFETLIAERR